MKNNLNIAVIGCGYWGKNLIRNFYQLGVLRLIRDKDEKLLDAFSKQYPKSGTCLALNDVLSSTDIDAVVIATPAETHFTIAREALISGKHVFIEKPMAMIVSEGMQLMHLSETKDRILMVGHLLRYHPGFKKLKSLADDGELGRINYIYSHRLNLGKIRREENILWSFAPHDISMILALVEDEILKVAAIGGNFVHKHIADVTTTHLVFKSGAQAHIFVSWLHPFKEQKLVVVGDKKMAVFDDTKSWEEKLVLYPHEIKWQHNMPVPVKAEAEKVVLEEAEPLRLECKHFIHCIQNRVKPITNAEEGLMVLRVLNDCQSSMDHGNTSQIDRLMGHHKDNRGMAISENSRYYINKTAVIDDNVKIGDLTKVWHFSHILKGTIIGRECNIGQNVVIGPDVMVGNKCKIQNNVSIYKGVEIEDGVFCGPSMVFTNVFNPRAEISKMEELRPTKVRKGATLGANCTIICGCEIGEFSFVGAGAVVTKDVPANALVLGNPAKQVGWVCHCGEKLNSSLLCMKCSNQYQVDKDKLKLGVRLTKSTSE